MTDSENLVALLKGQIAEDLSLALARHSERPSLATQLIDELRQCAPKAKQPLSGGTPFKDALRDYFPPASPKEDCDAMGLLAGMLDRCWWFRADDLYPQEQYRHFSEKVWGAEIMGQDTALFSVEERFIALLVIIEPNTTYPLHAHRIEELYLVLSGAAEFSHDGNSWQQRQPGDIFYNKSWQRHSIRTSASPLVAMGLYLPPFGWEGKMLETGSSDATPK